MRITGTSGGNATWAGGAAVSQYCCCASRVGSGVATAVGVAGSVGTTVGRGVEGTVGTGVGGGVGAKVGTGVGATVGGGGTGVGVTFGGTGVGTTGACV